MAVRPGQRVPSHQDDRSRDSEGALLLQGNETPRHPREDTEKACPAISCSFTARASPAEVLLRNPGLPALPTRWPTRLQAARRGVPTAARVPLPCPTMTHTRLRSIGMGLGWGLGLPLPRAHGAPGA